MTKPVLPRLAPPHSVPLRAASRRLCDPPSLDDLDDLPDPLGRPGMGYYALRPEVGGDFGCREASSGWRGRGESDD